MEVLLTDSCDPASLSALALAFVGDGVYDLMVRQTLVSRGNLPVDTLHREAVRLVRCQAQADGVRKLLPLLEPEEEAVYKRGRNAHTNHIPKNASPADYHCATGFEALIGYLYLKGRMERLRQIFVWMQENEAR